jgi:hypothetical protein
MPVFIWMSPTALTVPNQQVFFSSQTIVGSATTLSSVAAAISGFSASYDSGFHGIQELQISLSSVIGEDQDGNPGVWVTPTMTLRNNANDPSSIVLYFTLVAIYGEGRLPATELVPATTVAGSPPVGAGATPVSLSGTPLWMFPTLTGFDLTFNDGQDHWLYDLACYVGAAPSSGNTTSVLGSISIKDASSHTGLAGVSSTVVAFLNTNDGYPFFQAVDIPVQLPSGTIPEPQNVTWGIDESAVVSSWGVFLTGFRMTNGANTDAKISSIEVIATARNPTTSSNPPRRSLPVSVTMLVNNEGLSEFQVSGSVSLVAILMVAPSVT